MNGIKPNDPVFLVVLYPHQTLKIPCDREFASDAIKVWGDHRSNACNGTDSKEQSAKWLKGETCLLWVPYSSEVSDGNFYSVAFSWSDVIALYVVEVELTTNKSPSEKLAEAQEKLVEVMKSSDEKFAEMLKKKNQDERKGEEWRGDE